MEAAKLIGKDVNDSARCTNVSVTWGSSLTMLALTILAANHAIDLQSGIVIGVPIPEADAMDDDLVGAAIDTAVKESM